LINVPGCRRRGDGLAEPASAAAEAYRTLWTAIHFATPEGQSRTILVASPGAEDGKTTLSCNLAIVMAKAGRRTLLVDADFRAPSLQQVFSLRSGPGLADAIGGVLPVNDAIQRGPVPGLDLLPAGTVPTDPAELLNSETLNELLTGLGERYDQVVIDSPPILPFADARILAASCDATLLLLRIGRTSRSASQASRDGLVSVGGNILGIVVNDVPEEHPYDYPSASRSVPTPDLTPQSRRRALS
jgi:polysaccharide biosynthesis transport protein